MNTYPQTLKAAKKAKGAEWELADALLAEVGRPGKRDEARFRDCQDYLAENGIEYSMGHLRDLRNTAVSFARPGTRKGITPGVASHAGAPEVIEVARRATGKDIPSKRDVQVARKAVAKAAKKVGAKTMPERKAVAKAIAAQPRTELSRNGNIAKLMADAMDIGIKADRFAKAVRNLELDRDERKLLRSDIEDGLTKWQFVLAIIDGRVADEAEEYLRSL